MPNHNLETVTTVTVTTSNTQESCRQLPVRHREVSQYSRKITPFLEIWSWRAIGVRGNLGCLSHTSRGLQFGVRCVVRQIFERSVIEALTELMHDDVEDGDGADGMDDRKTKMRTHHR